MQTFLALPSYSLLYKLKSQPFDTCKGLLLLRENSLFSNDTVLMLDEMSLQQEVQYDGSELTECDSNLQMYESILCFMENIRNNLLATKFFQIPALETTLMDLFINITPGPIHWSIFHRIHEQDLAIECHVSFAPRRQQTVCPPCFINFRANHHRSSSAIFSGRYNNFIFPKLNSQLVVGSKCLRKISS